ncbi:MAG: glycosyltransferase [Flavobacterium sp.]|nr:MAG: glycosyltransferase [Flavobacterium sp.]
MLSLYSFQNQHGQIKKLIHRTVGAPLLRQSRLHATTLLEWNDCMHINGSWQGFILPNIIRFPATIVAKSYVEAQSDTLTFGFLSRIDPKKGLELLFHALTHIDFDYKIRIAGSGDENYVLSLKNLSEELGLANKIDWCGWKNGDEKFEFLQSIDIFVLTSYNENFANTVIESLVIGTPVFLSNGVGLANYINENNLGWTCDTDIASISECLRLIYSQRDKLLSMQKRAPDLIKKDFSKENLAREYTAAYQQIA